MLCGPRQDLLDFHKVCRKAAPPAQATNLSLGCACDSADAGGRALSLVPYTRGQPLVPLSNTSINKLLQSASAIFDEAVEEDELIDANPVGKKRLKQAPPRIRCGAAESPGGCAPRTRRSSLKSAARALKCSTVTTPSR
jgi:hypothetical protein